MRETVVIAGAGAVGLATARQLALDSAQKDRAIRIIVIDPTTKLFDNASGYCAGALGVPPSGVFHPKGPQLPLAQLSLEMWRELARTDEKFKRMTKFDHRMFEGEIGGGETEQRPEDAVPEWFHALEGMSLQHSGECPTVDPQGVGEWLHGECIERGVEIRMSTRLVGAELDGHGRLESVTITTPDQKEPQTIRAHKLVLATGSWTQRTLDAIFKSHDIDLKPRVFPGSWIVFRNPQPPRDEREFATLVWDGPGRKAEDCYLELNGFGDSRMWASKAPPPSHVNIPLPDLVDTGVFSTFHTELDLFKERARKFINPLCADDDEPLQVIREGMCPIPMNDLDRPYMASVGTNRLVPAGGNGGFCHYDSRRPSGLFVACDHGFHGMKMSFGTGKFMAELILGRETSLNKDDYLLPPNDI